MNDPVLLVTAPFTILVAVFCIGFLAGAMRREKREADQQAAEYEKQIQQRREPKHARSQPSWAMPTRLATTAASIGPVILPSPRHAITFKGVHSTGEMRAVTDAYLADMAQRCAVDRGELATLPSEFSSLTDD